MGGPPSAHAEVAQPPHGGRGRRVRRHPTPPQPSARGPVFETESRREALARLTEGLGARDPFLIVTGEAGTGKTQLVREVVARWGARAVVAFVANTTLTRAEFLEHVVRRFGLEPPANATKPQLLDRLERRMAEAEGSAQVPVIVVDDAHQLDDELLDELRQLANVSVLTQRPLEIVLVGLPALETRLAEPALEAVRQRIAVRCQLGPLSLQETKRYLHEVILAPAGKSPEFLPRRTSREIFKRTGGVPRAINTLVGEAMRHAAATNAIELLTDHLALAAGGFEDPFIASPTTVEAPERSDVSAPSETRTPVPTTPDPVTVRSPEAAGPSTIEPEVSARPMSRQAPELEPPEQRDVRPAARSKPSDGTRSEDRELAPGKAPSEPAASPPAASTSLPAIPPTPGADEPRVREWISRFRKPDEAPFASLLLAASAGRDSAAVEFGADPLPAGDEAASGAAPPLPRMIRGNSSPRRPAAFRALPFVAAAGAADRRGSGGADRHRRVRRPAPHATGGATAARDRGHDGPRRSRRARNASA